MYFGFLLGKSTKEEHDEIKRYVLILSNLLKVIFYGVLFYFSLSLNIIYLFFALFLLYVLSLTLKNKDTMKFHDIVLLGFSFLFLQNNGLFLLIIFIASLVFENSFIEFDVKEEIYSFVLYVIVYVLFGMLY
ncbi:MAG: hypothetical protein PF569_07000 [Candidatus Woesearchaeota archaeon]|nr:hypothetical protein [Candidatus Woesearchaeota archaeon]